MEFQTQQFGEFKFRIRNLKTTNHPRLFYYTKVVPIFLLSLSPFCPSHVKVKIINNNSFTFYSSIRKSLVLQMWKLIEEAQILQNNIIQAEIDLYRIRQQNSANFNESNEFIQPNSVQQENIDDPYIQFDFKGKSHRIPNSESWPDVKSKVEIAIGQTLTQKGENKIRKMLGFQEEQITFQLITEQSESRQEASLQSEPKAISVLNHKIENVSNKIDTKKVRKSFQKNTKSSQGKENQSVKNAYMEIYRRKKEILS